MTPEEEYEQEFERVAEAQDWRRDVVEKILDIRKFEMVRCAYASRSNKRRLVYLQARLAQ